MDADTCFAAMQQHRLSHLSRPADSQTDCEANADHDKHELGLSEHHQLKDLLAGPQLAHSFARAAAAQLSSSELASLSRFFLRDAKQPTLTSPELADVLKRRLETFHEAEQNLSRGEACRLAAPSGDPGADLGLILHIQHCDGNASAFWDSEGCATIQLLNNKGFRRDRVFAYDWHWRAVEASDRSNPRCPAKAWPQPLQRLHSELSNDLLQLLPLPFVIIGGSCAQSGFEKTIDKRFRSIEMSSLAPNVRLKFWLDFNAKDGELKRCIAFVHHPAAIYYVKQSLQRQVAVSLDACLNLILWLFGHETDATLFLKKASVCHYTRMTAWGLQRGTKGAPLAELYMYRRREARIKSRIQLSEYAPEFLAWVSTFLDEDPAAIYARGASIVESVQRNISAKISQANRRRHAASRKRVEAPATITSAAPSATTSSTTRGSNNSRSANTKQTNQEKRPAKRKRERGLAGNGRGSSGSADAARSSKHLAARQTQQLAGGNNANTQHSTTVEEPSRTPKVMVQRPPESADDAGDDISSTTSEDERIETDSLPQNQYTISAAEVEEALTELSYELISNGNEGQNPYSHLDACSFLALEYEMASAQALYAFRLSNLSSSLDDAERRLTLSRMDNALRVKTHDIRKHYGVKLKPRVNKPPADPSSPNANQAPTADVGSKTPSSATTLISAAIPRDPSPAQTVGSRNRDEQRSRLLEGYEHPLKEGCSRVMLTCGLSIWVPQHLGVQSMYIRCDLLPADAEHRHRFAADALRGDPAARLGVEFRFNSVEGTAGSTNWATTTGLANAKRANSMVDFLEGKSIEYTENQPRRFLGKNKGRGRSHYVFTDDPQDVGDGGQTGLQHEGTRHLNLLSTNRGRHFKRPKVSS